MRISTTIPLHRARLRLMTAGLLAVSAGLLCGCSLEDPRDICCTDASAMTYTYRPYGTEAFTDYIFTLRHFLFLREGELIGELPPGEDLTYQPLDLPQGEYTMVTLGNAAASTVLNHDMCPHVSGFTLRHTPSTEGGHADELYWGIRHFAIDSDHRATDLGPTSGRTTPGALTRLTTEMNNIHCHITIRVEWANMPLYIGTHIMELDGVPSHYRLDPEEISDAGGFVIPEVSDSLTRHRISVAMDAHTLEGEFTTLRLTDEHIPTLRLYYNGEQVGPDMDLGKAFTAWGWHPSRIHVQKYQILVRLYGDGSAELSPSLDASVADWINGGTFS
ncbi:MAG: FimB/Mfa2 family fimbrial subunit [Paramuribaculum sp.]|nr:FimB/Mfa2 family fimbrial subunit [Paramuribaculum sp.]